MALTDKLPSMAGHCTADSQHGASLCVPAGHQQRHAKGSAHAALSRVILSKPQRQVTQGLEGWQGCMEVCVLVEMSPRVWRVCNEKKGAGTGTAAPLPACGSSQRAPPLLPSLLPPSPHASPWAAHMPFAWPACQPCQPTPPRLLHKQLLRASFLLFTPTLHTQLLPAHTVLHKQLLPAL